MPTVTPPTGLDVVGLFAGIGGIEIGLGEAGHRSKLLCEIDDGAQAVLEARFDEVEIQSDVTRLEDLPSCDLVAAGFPCQDLSQAGRTAGITGSQSSLVEHVFRLLDSADSKPTWLLLENVSFMLSLDRGNAMTWLVEQLEGRGFTWAYRVVDSQAFGLPQRRQRVLLLASRSEDPRPILLNQDEHPALAGSHHDELGCGFYWTEGLRGLGWAIDAVPTLKGGSGLGIPSPPRNLGAGLRSVGDSRHSRRRTTPRFSGRMDRHRRDDDRPASRPEQVEARRQRRERAGRPLAGAAAADVRELSPERRGASWESMAEGGLGSAWRAPRGPRLHVACPMGPAASSRLPRV